MKLLLAQLFLHGIHMSEPFETIFLFGDEHTNTNVSNMSDSSDNGTNIAAILVLREQSWPRKNFV